MMSLTTLPFGGFYNSIHESELDHTLESIFSDSSGIGISSLIEKVYDQSLIDWKAVHIEYAKAYAENFADEFKIEGMVFDELNSPTYYNYETDRIFVRIPMSEVKRIYSEVDKARLDQKIKERFTSYDGFCSHYSNKLSEWPEDLEEWDHNRIGTLLMVYADMLDPRFNEDCMAELALMEGTKANGELDNMIYNNMKDAERLFKIRDYLVEREERQYRA